MAKSPSLYIPIHVDLWGHRKFEDLREDLEVDEDRATMLLVRLWARCVGQTLVDGILPKWNARAIARAARWEGDADFFLARLVANGWIDVMEDGTLRLHDWDLYAGRGATRREQGAAASADYRERKAAAEGRPFVESVTRHDDADDASYDGDDASFRAPSRVSNEGKGREGKGREGKGTEENGTEGRGREGERSLDQARAKVIQDNRNERNRKKAAAEAIYDRPQTIQALLAHPTLTGETTEVFFRSRFELFDGKQGRPTVEERVAVLWDASLGKPWTGGGRDLLSWFCTRLSEDHQKLRQSEHIIAEKQARGVTLASDAPPPQTDESAADIAAWKACLPNSEGAVPRLAQWRAAGRPSQWGEPATAVPTPRVIEPAHAADEKPPMTAEQEAEGLANIAAFLGPLHARYADTAKPQQRAPQRAEEAPPKESEEQAKARRAKAVAECEKVGWKPRGGK